MSGTTRTRNVLGEGLTTFVATPIKTGRELWTLMALTHGDRTRPNQARSEPHVPEVRRST